MSCLYQGCVVEGPWLVEKMRDTSLGQHKRNLTGKVKIRLYWRVLFWLQEPATFLKSLIRKIIRNNYKIIVAMNLRGKLNHNLHTCGEGAPKVHSSVLSREFVQHCFRIECCLCNVVICRGIAHKEMHPCYLIVMVEFNLSMLPPFPTVFDSSPIRCQWEEGFSCFKNRILLV